MPTPHINAPEGAFAPTVLMPGDPLRARFIAETFLTEPKLVNDVRCAYAYTGTYRDRPVSVMASGMGMPSIGIYSHELYSVYGVRNIIRVGSAGSYTAALAVHDVCLAVRAVSDSTYARLLCGNTATELLPSAELNAAIRAAAARAGLPLHEAVVHSSDVFYAAPGGQQWQLVRDNAGADCVEMESFALFANAALLGRRAACLLTISDSLVTGDALSAAADRQQTFLDMARLALETAADLV